MAATEDANAMVSCLMVTRLSLSRLESIRAAIAAFQAQTYTHRELVVILDASADTAGRRELDVALRGFGPAPVRVVEVAGTQTLGALRNRALAAAAGDYVCQWDDDDIYHPDRLSAQIGALRDGGFEALLLQEVLQFFPTSRTLYWTNWRATEAGGHPGTLVMRRGVPVRYPETGPDAKLGEDLALVRGLRARGALGFLGGEPHLFAYVSHGSNSWDDGHHRMLAQTLAISRGLLVRQEGKLRPGVAGLGLGAGAIQVCGANGPAFDIEAAGSV